jgi:hypothetical protein
MTDAIIWWTGAVAWIGVSALASLMFVFLLWRATYATKEVVRQLWLHHITRGKTKAERYCTPGAAWRSAFFLGPRRFSDD